MDPPWVLKRFLHPHATSKIFLLICWKNYIFKVITYITPFHLEVTSLSINDAKQFAYVRNLRSNFVDIEIILKLKKSNYK
jgi:hypothetical protein